MLILSHPETICLTLTPPNSVCPSVCQIMTDIQKVHCLSAEAQELYDFLKSPHIQVCLSVCQSAPQPFHLHLNLSVCLSVCQALLSSHDSVAQVDYGPVLPPLPDEMPEDEQAMRIVCLVKNNQPLVRPCGDVLALQTC